MTHRLFDRPIRSVGMALVCLSFVAACAGSGAPKGPAAVPEIKPGILAGYLQPLELPDSLVLIPPPPGEGSAALELDQEVSRASMSTRGTPRWDLAVEDANLMFPEAAGAFSCALGVPITETDTPHLYMLLRRTLTDAGLSTYGAKNHYQRPRPFMTNGQGTCTPTEEDGLRKDGSYPSGHTAIGWAWALVLTEIAPHRADVILARGRAFGESRIVCNVHWYSDVVEGRFVGAAAVARLHADPEFRAELEAAKGEYSHIRGKGLTPTRDCRSEADALTRTPVPFDADILHSWQGDYPVARLLLLPEGQREQGAGFIDNPSTFGKVWEAFKPGEEVPDIDFNASLVLFVCNTQFYNRVSIGKVAVTDGVADLLSMETMSAIPIEDKVGMAMVAVPRRDISGLRSGDTVIPVNRNP